MSKTRNNHYVPQWYQEGFFESGRNNLAYLDLAPPRRVLDDGRVIIERDFFNSPPSRAFVQKDLYSTFFGTSINDEIERRLFGEIDTTGSKAVRAFIEADPGGWHRHFETLFTYIDIQKIRTPKGLDWLRAQYPALSQNELMLEMQGVRMMHCTIWAQGVREIVSAEDSDIKFIVSDHPVTIYNVAAPPGSKLRLYPQDPTIALKGSQTIFPLNRDYCLILTNLEYAEDPSTNVLEKRTFPRNFRSSMAKTDAFIRSRKLSSHDVARINLILKRGARRYVAAGCKEWLYPEAIVSDSWSKLATALQPPKNELWNFGGEMFVRYDDGHVHYQDQFGRTEKQREFLMKPTPAKTLRPRDACGCGSGKRFGLCCERRPVDLRPTWTELGIRERNLLLYRGISNVLRLSHGQDWNAIRRELTDDKIKDIYLIYASLWPLETDLLQLLPKPDGTARAVYTGAIHPTTIVDFALSIPLYFGELLVEHPFMHPGTVNKKFSPVDNPSAYRQEILKALLFFLRVMPLVEAGIVNLVPDPCYFDLHLRDQMMYMARTRTEGIDWDLHAEGRIETLAREDSKRAFLSMPREVLQSQILKMSPELTEAQVQQTLKEFDRYREIDPLAVLQKDPVVAGKDGGLFTVMKLAPNFEMTMYLAQATGSCIVTDSPLRWSEIQASIHRKARTLTALSSSVGSASFGFPQVVEDVVDLAFADPPFQYSVLMRDAFKYLTRTSGKPSKPNFEQSLAARFARAHAQAQATLKKTRLEVRKARMSAAFPLGGIQDNSVNRLLLMSSSEKHLSSVPMAFFVQPLTPAEGDRMK